VPRRVIGLHQVPADHYLVSARAQAGHGVQHADVRAHARHLDDVRGEAPEHLVQPRLVEPGEGAFGDRRAAVCEPPELGHHLVLAGPLDAVTGEHRELGVVGEVAVGEEDHGLAPGLSLREAGLQS